MKSSRKEKKKEETRDRDSERVNARQKTKTLFGTKRSHHRQHRNVVPGIKRTGGGRAFAEASSFSSDAAAAAAHAAASAMVCCSLSLASASALLSLAALAASSSSVAFCKSSRKELVVQLRKQNPPVERTTHKTGSTWREGGKGDTKHHGLGGEGGGVASRHGDTRSL